MEAIKLYIVVLSVAFVAIGIVLFALNHHSKAQRDVKEPVYIEPKIPFIGHALGLVVHKHDYYVNLR